jgi:dTDP-4-amino-4,6-dideoxygalactose transaminase
MDSVCAGSENTLMILFSSPLAQYTAHRDEIDAAVHRVFGAGHYILGEEVEAFENEFAKYIGVSSAIGVGNGTDAVYLALKTCGIGPGDEVITVSHTAVATAAAVNLTGANPVFVDIEPEFFAIDPAKVKTAITQRTKAIIAVHIYGQATDLSPLLEIARTHNLRLIEDCAQAHGAMYKGKRVGSWGDMGCFSFYPTKNLGAIGDGGALVTNDPALAGKARLLCQYGWDKVRSSQVAGWNTRLDEVQAAILRVKLKYLDAENSSRNLLADLYCSKLKARRLVLPVRRNKGAHVYHLYVVRHPERDLLAKYLSGHGIPTAVHYPLPVHLQPAYERKGCVLPETERAAKEILSLPMYPELSEADALVVAENIMAFEERGGGTC